MLIEELRNANQQTRKEFAAILEATEQSVYRWEAAGYETTDRRIHPLFRKQLERMRRKIEGGQ